MILKIRHLGPKYLFFYAYTSYIAPGREREREKKIIYCAVLAQIDQLTLTLGGLKCPQSVEVEHKICRSMCGTPVQSTSHFGPSKFNWVGRGGQGRSKSANQLFWAYGVSLRTSGSGPGPKNESNKWRPPNCSDKKTKKSVNDSCNNPFSVSNSIPVFLFLSLWAEL